MEETVKSKQFDVCETLYHSVQSATFVNSQFFRKWRYLTIKYPSVDGNYYSLFNINEIELFKHGEVNKHNFSEVSERL